MVARLLNLFRKEKLTLDVIQRIAHIWVGQVGRMLSFSKLIYLRDHKTHWVLFNANIYIKYNGKFTKVWYGDLNITKDIKELKGFAKSINHDIYILKEWDGRDESTATSDTAVFVITAKGKEHIKCSGINHISLEIN